MRERGELGFEAQREQEQVGADAKTRRNEIGGDDARELAILAVVETEVTVAVATVLPLEGNGREGGGDTGAVVDEHLGAGF